MSHKPLHYVEYFFMLVFQLIIRLLPLRVVVYGASYFAGFLTFFLKFRYDVAVKNLSSAFPEMSGSAKKNIIIQSYKNILIYSFESYKYMYISADEKKKNLRIDADSDELLSAIKEKGKGCVVVGGHYGFFEAGGHYGVSRGLKCAYVVANQKNKLTEKLIDIPRERSGLTVIHRKNMMKLFRSLKQNYFVALLSDQNAGRKHGVFVEFFGKQASTHKNPAVISLKYNIPMIIVNTVRRKDDLTKHDLSFKKIPFDDIISENTDFESKVIKLVQRYTRVLEDQIRTDPTHYWWIHKRFKTQPKRSK